MSESTGMRRIGLLGGAFDPPHLGHLRLAELAWERLGLDELRFVPTHIPPHKPEGSALAPQRLALLQEALSGRPAPWTISEAELDREGPSFTVDTLEECAAREPGAAWILLMGSDQAASFHTWMRPERILELASLAVAQRPEGEAALPPMLHTRVAETWSGTPGGVILLPSSQLALSSSELRRKLAAGLAPEGLPPQVQAFLGREKLYR